MGLGIKEQNIPDGVGALVVDGEGTVRRDRGGESDEGSEGCDGLHDEWCVK